MNKKELKKYLLEHEGATLSADTLEPSQEKKGYMVSLYGTEKKEKELEKVIDIIEKRAEELKKGNNKEFFVGVWYYDGAWYVDTSRNIKDLKHAIYYGESQKQLAIYDLKNNKDIMLKYKKIKYYTMYRIIKNNNDEIINEIPIKQYDSITEIEKELNMKSNCIYKDIKRHSLINNQYYIYLDYMLASEIDMTA